MTIDLESALNKISYTKAIVALVLFVTVGLWLIFEYLEKERDRDLMSWQLRMAVIAEIKSNDIESILDSNKSEIINLSENASIKLLLTQIIDESLAGSNVVDAQQGHVRNLLISSAGRFGFNESRASVNINKTSSYGLAMLDQNSKLVMSTKGFKPDVVRLRMKFKSVIATGKTRFIDIYSGDKKQPIYGYMSPVFKIQEVSSSDPVGVVLVLMDPRNTIYKALESRHEATKTDESFMVRRTEKLMQYISPLKGGAGLFHQLADENKMLASSYAYFNPGSFSELKDYRGVDVLSTGRNVRNTPWLVVQTITSSEAMVESKKHQQFLLTVFGLILLFLTAAFVAVWKQSISRRLMIIASDLKARTALLDAVANNMKDYVVLLDNNQKIIFMNKAFSEWLGVKENEIKYAPAINILGKQVVDDLMSMALGTENKSMSIVRNDLTREYHVNTIQLTEGEYKDTLLCVMHDISVLKQAEIKREMLSEGIIATLVKAVDLHDPYCVNHSQRTREVALEVGGALGLSKERLRSLEMAAMLANIGKLFVPKEILTKMDNLTEEESEQLKLNIEYAVKILSELPFDGPVLEIINQKNERLDGSGYPAGLKSEQILLESRILAVANTFVAMTSSRAYREGRKVDEVVNILLGLSKSQYDRHVVAALFHIAENKADWKSWRSIDPE